MNYTIRPYSQSDYDFVWNLHIKENKSYIDKHMGVPLETAKGWFDANVPKQKGFIIEHAEERIGCYFIEESPDFIKLSRFFLLEKMQGKGLGSELLNMIIQKFYKKDKPFKIMVWKDNPVQDFWKKRGFSHVSTGGDNLMTMVYEFDGEGV